MRLIPWSSADVDGADAFRFVDLLEHGAEGGAAETEDGNVDAGVAELAGISLGT